MTMNNVEKWDAIPLACAVLGIVFGAIAGNTIGTAAIIMSALTIGIVGLTIRQRRQMNRRVGDDA